MRYGKTMTEQQKSRPTTAVGVILYATVALIYAANLMEMLGCNPLSPQMLKGLPVWTGFAFAYLWRRKMRDGWAGFGIGILIGLAAMWLMTTGSSALRNGIHKDECAYMIQTH